VVVLAHQGGWDEILVVLVPLALFAFLLRLANKRAESMHRAAHDDGAPESPPAEAD
jgi:hypothetical protein